MKTKLVAVILVLGISLSCAKQPTENSALTSSGTQATPPRNSVEVVKASAQEISVKPNEPANAIVQLEIEKGYHVNANPPTFPYLKATELEIAKTEGITVSFIVYPDPITKSFPFAEKPLAVYEGVTNIKVQFKADKAAKPGSQNLPAKLRVQACDDKVCYAPGTLDVNIPLSIK